MTPHAAVLAPGSSGLYTHPWRPGEPEEFVFDGLFDLAAGNGYAQPKDGGTPLPGVFQSESGDFAWIEEAIHQHRPTTYMSLVDKMYPLAPAQEIRRSA